MRNRMAATLALLTTTALSGAALAAGDVAGTTAAPGNTIVLAQASGSGSDSSGGGNDTGTTGDNATDSNAGTGTDPNAGDVPGEDPTNTGDDDSEADDDDSAVGDGDATETPSTDGDPQPHSGNTDSTAVIRGMDESATHRSYMANAESGTATFPAGYSAEDFLDRDIVNAQGEELGEVVDLIVDQNNEVSMVVADIGGFLGLGESRVAIDIDDITLAEGSGGLVVSMDQSELEALPTYEENDGIWSLREE